MSHIGRIKSLCWHKAFKIPLQQCIIKYIILSIDSSYYNVPRNMKWYWLNVYIKTYLSFIKSRFYWIIQQNWRITCQYIICQKPYIIISYKRIYNCKITYAQKCCKWISPHILFKKWYEHKIDSTLSCNANF